MHSEFLNKLWNDLCLEFIYEIESQIRSYVEELEIRLFVLFLQRWTYPTRDLGNINRFRGGSTPLPTKATGDGEGICPVDVL